MCLEAEIAQLWDEDTVPDRAMMGALTRIGPAGTLTNTATARRSCLAYGAGEPTMNSGANTYVGSRLTRVPRCPVPNSLKRCQLP